MKRIVITSRPGFDDWRLHARACLLAGLAPDQVIWQDEIAAYDLFGDLCPPPVRSGASAPAVPKDFIELAQSACCHTAPDRFALLYRILWRLCHGERHLLKLKTDDDILRLHAYVKAVRRDAYKIKAFLRFRDVGDGGEEFVAWYEPEHYSLELSLPFFQTRFKNMTWSILTPYRAAYWDRETLTLADNPDPASCPQDDAVEKYWLTYYASIFNPARPKKQAMLNQMPKKYWKNMPETVLIQEMLHTSEARARHMVEQSRSAGRASEGTKG